MSLENWRSLNYLTADVNAYSLFLVCAFCLLRYNYLSRQMRLIAYYSMVCTILEIILGVFLKQDKPEEYFSFIDHLYVFFEVIFIWLFIYNTLETGVFKKIVLCVITGLLIFQLKVFLTSPLLDSRYSSALLASTYSILILISLFDQSQKKYKGRFYKLSEVIVVLDFLLAYLILLILFWFLPSITEYSRIWANIAIIIKNLVGVLFEIILVYIIWKSSSRQLKS
jgi:hypothetical protein